MNTDFDGFSIHKNEHEHTFQIKCKQSSPVLIHSLLKTRLIHGHTDETNSVITLNAYSVKTLREFKEEYKRIHKKDSLMVSDLAKAIQSLTKQLSYLLTYEKHTILGYNPEYIVVINDTIFVFICNELIVPLVEHNNLAMICTPYSAFDFYFSPEMRQIKKIPVFLDYKTAFFSFGCLLVYLLTGNNDFYRKYLGENVSNVMLRELENHPIKNTKIYWMLSRCLVENYKNRTFILI